MAKKQTEIKEKQVNDPKFSKADILSSTSFTKIEKDILSAVLDNVPYTLKEARNLLDKKLKGVVK
ncbi:hypothetical protein FZX01_15885 [Listeria monocytogenes]|uniref:hypothetical protein n=1 Tax=Listeria monocytogenes TaxID=1639 RepID=UPI0011EAD409|nr:hypothetical protein [Listeria monocytogenes]TYU82170.1 hypothetical protein FZX01_15885 [Listeria monocytogenes]